MQYDGDPGPVGANQTGCIVTGTGRAWTVALGAENALMTREVKIPPSVGPGEVPGLPA